MTYEEVLDRLLPLPMIERSIGELLAAHPDLARIEAANLLIVERVLGLRPAARSGEAARRPTSTH